MHTFNKLNKSKQETIINAAIKEFAEKGYEGGNTNDIVKNAGISKGALFLYFGSKEALYMYLLEYAYNFNTETVLSCIDLSESDLFNRIAKYMHKRLEVTMEHPYMSMFLEKLLAEKPPCASNFIKLISSSATFQKHFIEGIDTSNLRSDIPLDKILSIILYTFEGLNNAIIPEKVDTGKDVDYEKVYNEGYEYLECFKQIFCKN